MHIRTGISVLALIAACGAANAQTTPASSSQDEPAVVEDIIVTAQRREESLQRAGLSVTAVSGEDLQAEGRSKISDIIASIPGVQLSGNPRGPSIFIRGVGTDRPPQFGDAPIATNVDGVYLSRPEGLRGAFYDLARVEVLRGPQGTLYGRNATGGAVNVLTAAPRDEFEARVSTEIGSQALIKTEGMVNLPLGEDLAVRAAYMTDFRDGFLSNGGNDSGVISGRLKTLWTPSDTVRLSGQADYTTIRGNGVSYVDIGVSARDNPWATTLPSDINEDNRLWTVQAQADIDLSFGRLTIVPAYRDFERDARTFVSGNYTIETSADQQTSLEARLASNGDGRLSWTVGGFWLAADQPISTLTEASGEGQNMVRNHTDSRAIFGQASLALGDDFRLVAGGRYTQDEKEARSITISRGVNNGVVASNRLESDSFDYRLGFEYDASETSLLYAQVSTGYKNGGFNALPRTIVTYEPETIQAYLIGSKNRFLDGRLQVNAEAFYYDYQDYQTVEFRLIPAIGNFAPVTINAESATLFGGEIETIWAPTSRDRFNLSLAYLNTEFGPLISGGVNYEGYPLQRSPKWTIPFGYQRVFDFSNGASLTARFDGIYKSGSHTNFAQTASTYDGAHTMGDVSLTLTDPTGRLSLGAYVKNVGDYAEMLQVATGAGGAKLIIGPPRTVGLLLTANF
jgi:iron complex outermembrane receptor protein